MSKIITEKTSNLSFNELQNQLDIYISDHCYFNLLTHSSECFNEKLKHNLKLAKEYEDHSYLNYLKRKFKLDEDLFNLDLSTWNYKCNKIKIKLKSPVSTLTSEQKLTIETSLSDLLKISPNQTFKYKSEIVRLIHKYIYDHKLQNRNQKHIITPDQQLSKVLSPLSNDQFSYTYENLPQHLMHLIK